VTTREAIHAELRKRAYPQTVEMLRDKIGKTTVQLLCRCLALEGAIIERRYHGQFWYAARTSQFTRRPYRIEWMVRPGQWRVLVFRERELGGKQDGANFAHQNPGVPCRLVCGQHVICEWNTPEIESWQSAKKTLSQVRTVLRDRSNSLIAVFERALSSPR
jgi:hypothetical protein